MLFLFTVTVSYDKHLEHLVTVLSDGSRYLLGRSPLCVAAIILRVSNFLLENLNSPSFIP